VAAVLHRSVQAVEVQAVEAGLASATRSAPLVVCAQPVDEVAWDLWVDMKVSVQCQLVPGRELGTDRALEFGLRRALAVMRRHDE